MRDAEIGLAGAPGSSVKDDLGAVPLLYAYSRYQATYTFAFFHYAVAGVRIRF